MNRTWSRLRSSHRAASQFVGLIVLGSAMIDCSGSESAPAASGGGASSDRGGASATGTSNNQSSLGGNATSGGTSAMVGTTATGGSATAGTSESAGGSWSSGGAPTIGGSLTAAGSNSKAGTTASGGATATGGRSATAGSTATGGTKATGGTTNTGGSKASGGNTSIAGATAVGGTKASGGTASSAGASGLDQCGRPTSVAIPSGYSKLTWHDEFDVDGAPNSANWGYEKGFVRNNELQWYQSNNASVANGLLTITGKRERVTNPNYSASGSDWKTTRQYAEYTSTSMTTSGKQTWKFGRFEMCGKIPISSGMWPAWWTLGISGEWPSNGEIDIMEFYKGKILANVACGTSTRWSAKWDSYTRSVDATWAASYHLWRMDWNSTKIDLYVDDSLMNTANLSDMLNSDGKSPFLQDVYMIVNLAIGGDNGGDPTNTSFPQQYSIDYIRVFQ